MRGCVRIISFGRRGMHCERHSGVGVGADLCWIRPSGPPVARGATLNDKDAVQTASPGTGSGGLGRSPAGLPRMELVESSWWHGFCGNSYNAATTGRVIHLKRFSFAGDYRRRHVPCVANPAAATTNRPLVTARQHRYPPGSVIGPAALRSTEKTPSLSDRCTRYTHLPNGTTPRVPGYLVVPCRR